MDTNGLKRTPRLPAFRELQSSDLLAWCPFCDKWHRHGGGLGHRQPHCSSPYSPFVESGYILIDMGPAPAAVAKHAK